jgi:hypothetical protein
MTVKSPIPLTAVKGILVEWMPFITQTARVAEHLKCLSAAHMTLSLMGSADATLVGGLKRNRKGREESRRPSLEVTLLGYVTLLSPR